MRNDVQVSSMIEVSIGCFVRVLQGHLTQTGKTSRRMLCPKKELKNKLEPISLRGGRPGRESSTCKVQEARGSPAGLKNKYLHTDVAHIRQRK